MINIEKIDDELYKSIYIEKNINKYNEIWCQIKNNKKILKEAIQVKRNKWKTGDTVSGLAITNNILINYETIDSNIYQELTNSIYTNTDIARTVIDGASNGGYSFLLMSLWNHNLKLTESQKSFAVTEAMNKIGTTYWKHKEELFSKELEDKGITDRETSYIILDGSINPIGKKAGSEYMYYINASLSREQAHGKGCYDIRYCILRNPNWTLEEKQKLIMDFWAEDKDYEDTLEEWEWGIINDSSNYKDDILPLLDKSYLYEYTYEDLLNFYNDKKTTQRIWEEIEFCKQMHNLREVSWKLDFNPKKKVLS